MTVRHPYERLVSAYTNKLKDCIQIMFRDGLMLETLRDHREVNESLSQEDKETLLEAARLECWKPLDERTVDPDNPYMNPLGVTFMEFIKKVISTYLKNGHRPPHNDPHWLPASDMCAICSIDYDIIEKFETLERDHHYVMYKAGLLELLPMIAGSHSNSARRTHTVYDYFKLLDETQLWYLSQMYMEDFELFGYTPHYYVKYDPRL